MSSSSNKIGSTEPEPEQQQQQQQQEEEEEEQEEQGGQDVQDKLQALMDKLEELEGPPDTTRFLNGGFHMIDEIIARVGPLPRINVTSWGKLTVPMNDGLPPITVELRAKDHPQIGCEDDMA